MIQKKQQIFLPRVVLVIILCIIVGVGVYIFTLKYKTSSAVLSVPSITSTPFVKLAPTMPPSKYAIADNPTKPGWKRYTNQTYNFSFSYPADKLVHFMILDSDNYSTGIRLSTVPVDPHGYPQTTDGVIFDIDASSEITDNINFFNTQEAQKYYYDTKFVTVDGEKGVIYTLLHNPQPQNDSSNIFYIAETIHNSKQYKFSLNALSKDILIHNEPLLEQIFSTVKFL